MRVVIGLDLGTQSLKAVVCDERLVVLGDAQLPHATRHPRPGWAEQDPATWDAALAPVIARALAKANAKPAEVVAVALAGQLDGCVAVDAAGEVLHPALIWQDRRAIEHVDRAGRAGRARTFELTGQIADPSHLAPKVCWLRAHGIGAARFHQPTSYLVERLTGAAAIDHAHASTTMLYDLAAGTWSAELLAAFAIRSSELPELRPATAIAGCLHARGAALAGLPIGTPVAVGTGDDFATPLGAGVAAPGPVICAIGTAEVVGALALAPIRDRALEPMLETHAYPTGAYFVENPGWLSGGAVRWAAALLGLGPPEMERGGLCPTRGADAELDALAATAPPGAGGVTFIPALAGAMTPVWRPHARGTLHGLTAAHDRSHVARAVLEGLAFACRDVVDRLAALGLPTAEVLVLGGGGASALWTQIRADALARPHRVAARTDTCAVGAAMIAWVAAGLVPDLAAACALVPPPPTRYAPQASLDDAYARYRRLVAQLAPLGDVPWV